MKNKNNRIYRIIFFISILLISISMVSSIGIWKNRSFFFDGYIYSNYLNSEVIEYCAELYRFITGDMSDKEEESFQVQNQGTYYHITDDSTKETFTNLPKDIDYIEFSSRPNIISFQYNNNQRFFLKDKGDIKLSIIESDYIDINPKNTNFSGFVFIDKNNESASGFFRYMIETGFQLQKILYLEIKIGVISLLFGVALYLISYKKVIRTLNEGMNVIPIDVKMGAPIPVQ